MSAVSILLEVLLEHSEAVAVASLGVYIAYEIRFGAMREVRENQRVLGIGLYRVIERDDDLDEEEFADALWGDNGGEILYRTLAEESE